MIAIVVRRGRRSGFSLDSSADVVRIGRSADSELELPDELVSGEHARVSFAGARYVLRDLGSTNGTALLRRGERFPVDDGCGREVALETGDEIELGSGDGAVLLAVTITADSDDARVVAVRSIAEIGPTADHIEGEPGLLAKLYAAQKRIGAAADMSEVLIAIGDAVFDLVQQATHTTLVLRDDDDDGAGAGAGGRDAAKDGRSTGVAGYVPVVTRVRGQAAPEGPIPITRSVFRKVVTERAAVIAADAPQEVSQTESLMGASIRSTMGVPLWRGDEILGVIQIDNRKTAGVFTSVDLELMAVLAHNASLAVANARLVRRLRAAEERLKKENAYLKGREETRRTGGRGQQEIIGQSPAMRQLNDQLNKVVDTRVTVLIEGETGAGKELVASAIHYRSRRRDKLFVAQNCAAMPEQLLESELFGHKRGAFTGAVEEKKGLFEIADGGTLFLDEVTEMPVSLQSKLLRVLQEGEIRPVGATTERRVNVRIVAATNRNLEKEVEAGRFREDLYYRLKVFPLRVPSLRERREDIPLLAEFFLHRYSGELGKSAAGYAQQAMEMLQAYDFPGNVRELQNEVQRLVIQVEPNAFITPDLLSPRIRKVEGVFEKVRPTKGTLKEMMDQLERWLLLEALNDHDNNKTATAKTLGITREGLHKKLKGFGIS